MSGVEAVCTALMRFLLKVVSVSVVYRRLRELTAEVHPRALNGFFPSGLLFLRDLPHLCLPHSVTGKPRPISEPCVKLSYQFILPDESSLIQLG